MKSYIKMDKVEENGCESYKERCGEIFLTVMGNLNIHCTLCETIYKSYETYASHIYEEHFQNFEDSLSVANKSENVVDPEFLNEDSTNLYDNTQDMEFGEHFLEDFDSKEKINNVSTDESLSLNVDDFKPEISVSIEKCLQDDKQEDSTDPLADKSEYNIRKVRQRTYPRTTDKERKYKCETCGSSFFTKKNLSSHRRRHSFQKNYKCPNCYLRFYTTTEVKQHLRSHKDERNFLCSVCGNSFKTKADLTLHIKRHTNKRDFQCSLCDKMFFERKQLNYHMRRIHSSTRPFECSTCSATFLEEASLRAHKKVHGNQPKLKCYICEKLFDKERGLLFHLKHTHKLEKAEMLNS